MVGKFWGEQISGPILALIGFGLLIAQAYVTDAPTATAILKWGATVTLGTAIFMVLVAQYKAWSTERDNYEAAAAKNIRPELRGKAYAFTRGGSGGGDPRGSVEARFMVEICNHRSITTNITALEIDAEQVDKTMTISGIVHDGGSLLLEHGIAHRFKAKAELCATRKASTIPGQWPEPVEVDLSKLRILVVDGLGGKHPITVEPGSSLVF